MNYITHHRFKNISMFGKELNLPYGTLLECRNDILYYKDIPVCFASSENAKRYFSRDDDGKGLERGYLTYEIAFSTRGKGYRFTEKERNLITEKYSYWLVKDVDIILFNEDFFNADIPSLSAFAAELKVKRR